MRRAKLAVSLAAGAAAMTLMSSPVRAAGTAYNFIGASGADWFDTTAWSPTGSPAVGDSATVQVAGGNVAVGLSAPATVGALILGTPSGSPFTTDIGNGSTSVLTFDNTG